MLHLQATGIAGEKYVREMQSRLRRGEQISMTSIQIILDFLKSPCWTCEHAKFELSKPETCFDCVNMPKEFDWRNNDIQCEFWRAQAEWECPEDCRQVVIECQIDHECLSTMFCHNNSCSDCKNYKPKTEFITPAFNPKDYHKMEDYIHG